MDMATMPLGGAQTTTMPAGLGLSALDLRVVALARAEADRLGAAAFRARPAVLRALGRMFGMDSGVRRLADERLEALRRFVGLARRGDGEATAAAALLASFGLAPAAIELIRAFATR